MDYNTDRKKIILPEYGRNIHKMVDYLKTIEDSEKRNKMANIVIGIMGNMNPHLRDISDFKHKLWDHLFIMADFNLDIESPYPIPTRETMSEKPNRVLYPSNNIRFKHYGKTVENMVASIVEFEDGEKKNSLIVIMANHMKKNYLSWNRESVTDALIFRDLEILSKGKLKIPEGLVLTETKDIISHKPKRKKSNRGQSRNSDRKSRYDSRR